MKKIFYFILISSIALTTACKKDKGSNPANTKLQLTQDSIYMFAQEDYYWNDALPAASIFNPRKFTGTTDLLALSNEVDAYSQLKINPSSNEPYEYDDLNPGVAKYSFVDDGTVSGELNGTKGDFGFNYFYNTYTNIRVSLVYAGSPAAAAGLVRGDEITAINGNSGSSIYITNSSDPVNDVGYKFVSNAINSSSTVTLQIKRADGTTAAVNLTAKSYSVNPLITSGTYNLGNGKVAGYLVFNSFTSLAVAQPKLDSVFTAFASQNVTDIIVDLRYNGGGYVETSDYLSDLLSPSIAGGTLMNTKYWTANMQNDKDPLLQKKYGGFSPGSFLPANQTTKFSKKGSLSLSRVFFIVTGNTASASELTINNLRPKMDVQLIGETTYGKPVGFLSDLVINGYYLFTPEFETKNSAGQGGYYAGMTPGSSTYPGKADYDDLTKNFGDKTELLLNDALTYIQTNAYPTNTTLKVQSLDATTSSARAITMAQRRTLSVKANEKQFHGMVLKLKK
jgi:hypothetical protein